MSENRDYSPIEGLRRARKAMDSYSQKHTPATERPLTLSTNKATLPCTILLKSFTEGGPVPDDFKALPRTAAAIKAHVRPDGAVYKGAFELQGTPDSVVLVFGPKNLTAHRAERIAAMERLDLMKRDASYRLGPYAAKPAASVVPPSDTPSRAS